ncbi:MAG: FAD-dependent oxidoreductase, partial [Polymorphobacter sp.]
MPARRTQIVIAGAGPVGGVAALVLAAHGFEVTVFEAGSAVAADLRASTFHPPTIEMLDTLGLAAPLLAQGLKAPVYHWRERATGAIFAFDFGELADRTRYPFRIQCEQFHLARWLVERIDAAPTAALHFGHRVTGYTQDAGGVRVAVAGPGGSFEVAAEFLIGADGAGSAVRAVMGCGFEGFT